MISLSDVSPIGRRLLVPNGTDFDPFITVLLGNFWLMPDGEFTPPVLFYITGAYGFLRMLVISSIEFDLMERNSC